MAKVSRAQRTRSLQDVQVGDQLAPMRVNHRVGGEDEWTGTLRRVSKVTPKRIWLGTSTQIEKDSGREIGGLSGTYYIIATPEMVAEADRKHQEHEEYERKQSEFRHREDYHQAMTISFHLSEMTPDKHPLDCMTAEEWKALRIKICGPGGE